MDDENGEVSKRQFGPIPPSLGTGLYGITRTPESAAAAPAQLSPAFQSAPSQSTAVVGPAAGIGSSADELIARANRMASIRESNAALRDNLNFNAGGALSRQKTPDEIERDMLTGTSRSARAAAVELMNGRRAADTAQAKNLLDTETARARIGIDQQTAAAQIARNGIDADRLAAEQAREAEKWGIDKRILTASEQDSQQVRDGRKALIDAQNAGDPAAIATAKANAIALGILKADKPLTEYTAVTDSMGLNVTRTNKDTGAIDIINPKTGAVTSIPAPGSAPAVAPRIAPQSAIEFLKKNPDQSAAFKAKYGYLPEGY